MAEEISSDAADEAAPVALRPARESDEKRIKELVKGAGINPLGIAWERFTIAETHGGEIVGCGQLKPHKGDFIELASLVVEEAWRGQGLGGRLIRSLIEEASAPLWLMCRSPLVALYERFGFEEVPPEGDQPAYFARVRRLAAIYHWIRDTGEYLAIMVHPSTLP